MLQFLIVGGNMENEKSVDHSKTQEELRNEVHEMPKHLKEGAAEFDRLFPEAKKEPVTVGSATVPADTKGPVEVPGEYPMQEIKVSRSPAAQMLMAAAMMGASRQTAVMGPEEQEAIEVTRKLLSSRQKIPPVVAYITYDHDKDTGKFYPVIMRRDPVDNQLKVAAAQRREQFEIAESATEYAAMQFPFLPVLGRDGYTYPRWTQDMERRARAKKSAIDKAQQRRERRAAKLEKNMGGKKNA
jgi:hypothetical protein